MNIKMTRFSLFSAICLLVVSSALATPTCPDTTLASGTPPPAYENTDGTSNGFVCDINNLQFSNFSSSSPGVSPAAIGVVPITNPGLEGFTFTGPFGVGNNGQPQNENVDVSFTVTALSGLLTDVHIDLLASSITGTGNVNYTEQFCNKSNCSVFVDNPGTSSLSTEVLLANTAVGGPVRSLNITKDLSLTAGSNGTASISSFSNYYSHTVPEPRAVSILLGLGFLCVVAFMKWRQAVRSY